MQVCAPLRWPFPFVPFICKANEELLSSPIPIFGTMLDSQEVTLANGNPNSQFYSLWTKEAEASPPQRSASTATASATWPKTAADWWTSAPLQTTDP